MSVRLERAKQKGPVAKAHKESFGGRSNWDWKPFGGDGADFSVMTITDVEGVGGTFFLNVVLWQSRYLIWVSHDQLENADRVFEYTVSLLCGRAWDGGKKESAR